MASRLALAVALVLATSYAVVSYFRKRGQNSSSRSCTSKAVALFKGSPRLPKFAEPRRYDVELRIDLDACRFTGKSSVTIDIVQETTHLVLNAFDLAIHDGSVWLRCSSTRTVLWPTAVEIDKQDEILVLSFEQPLPVGEAILGLEFQGTLNDTMKGLYRSSYTKNGEKRYMAVTQFEPADARRCFPCWDEPAFKATFKLTIQAPADRVVLSNMPVEEEREAEGIKLVTFQESPKMSTYLVAIVVGELDYVESETPSGNKVRVYCAIGKTEQGKFALDVATKTLPFYEEYFGTAYPLPKMDMVAIPDFAAGAMENYGLVTYRESALLYDDKHSAAANKQRVAIVVAHELAHQWFGNLVTMEWWTHLWLNEGFATWVSFLAVDHLFPDWKIWTQFIEQTVSAFKLDGLVESHPIEVEVGHASEIDEIFDAISYSKGASIIQMLQNYLGADAFQKGLMSYIKKYAFKNASTEDLWTSLSEASGEPVKELMDSWTKQKGYPVLKARMKESALKIEQSQFLSSGLPGSGEWVVPVTVCHCSYSPIARSLVRGKVCQVALPTPMVDEETSGYQELNTARKHGSPWVKLNVGQTGFYRVQYEGELAVRIRAAIASGALNATDRFGVLDDTFAICSACKQPLSSLLSVMDVFREEADYTVLSNLIMVAHRVALLISAAIPEATLDFNRFIGKLLQYAAEKLGWEARERENHLDSMLRGAVMEALILFGNEDVVAEAIQRFNVFLQDRKTHLLPPDMRNAAYKAVMRKTSVSDRSGYDSLLNIYRETDLSQEKSRILSQLASSPDPAMVREALNYAISSEVRTQDTMSVFSGISNEGRETAWSWLKENWDVVWKKFGEGFLITRFITATTGKFSSDDKADEIEVFFGSRGHPSIERTINQSVEHVRINAQWVKYVRTEEGLKGYINELSYRSY